MIAVLFSEASRSAYATQAHDRKETYTFTDAWDEPRTWLKSEYAYLAPNAARLLLARCSQGAEIDDALQIRLSHHAANSMRRSAVRSAHAFEEGQDVREERAGLFDGQQMTGIRHFHINDVERRRSARRFRS